MNTGVGCHALLQGIFLTQGLNLYLLCLLHWQAGFFTTSTALEAHKKAEKEEYTQTSEDSARTAPFLSAGLLVRLPGSCNKIPVPLDGVLAL